MKSKSFILPSAPDVIAKTNKTYDFLNFYNSAAGNSINIKEKHNSVNNGPDDVPKMPERRQTSNKMAKKKFKSESMNVSTIDIDGQNLVSDSGKRSPINESKSTSTPTVSKNKKPCVKSIMRVTSVTDALDSSSVPRGKPKKRNKSVSFMLQDNEEVVIKKTKSDDSLGPKNRATNKNKIKKNKLKNKLIVKEDKENNSLKIDNTDDKQKIEIGKTKRKHLEKKKKNITDKVTNNQTSMDHEIGAGDTKYILNDDITNTNINLCEREKETSDPDDTANEIARDIKKKRRNRGKKQKSVVLTDPDKDSTEEKTEMLKQKPKKSRKSKHAVESSELEPVKKSKKKDKPDVIAQGIENLNIGDNAHTLTNLLDEMSVDKNKKKNKNKSKNKSSTEVNPEDSATNVKKTKKRKNRRKNHNLNAIVMVQNLPFSIILNYKQTLREHFSKFGKVHSVGIADLKCAADDAKPIFTTRVFFTTEEAAAAALTEDKALFENSIIRVKKYIAPAVRAVKHGSWVRNPSRLKTTPTENEEQAEPANDEIDQESGSD